MLPLLYILFNLAFNVAALNLLKTAGESPFSPVETAWMQLQEVYKKASYCDAAVMRSRLDSSVSCCVCICVGICICMLPSSERVLADHPAAPCVYHECLMTQSLDLHGSQHL